MEACGSSHYWARKLAEFGHTVKLMSPQFVEPYVKTNKHDRADAEAICEAVTRPDMRFVPIRNVEQQAMLSVHRARQGFVKARAAQANQIRGLLSEFGIVIPQGIQSISKRIPGILEDAENGLPEIMRRLLERLNDHLRELDRQVNELERQIKLWHKERGDTYLRTLLIHGARAVIRIAEKKAESGSWLCKLITRRNKNIAAVALANKNARVIWAFSPKKRHFTPITLWQ